MARTTRTAPKELTQEELIAAVVAALASQNTPVTPQETPKESKTPFLSCWTVSRIKTDPKGQFSHTDKRGVKRDYASLSEAEAIKLLKANYAAGRTYAIPA